MADVFSKSKRSWVMQRVKPRDTRPELLVRSFLHARGIRFRLHARHLPGRPDLVLRRYRTVIFVNGCFWHHHSGCARAKFPKLRAAYWRTKIEATIDRDRNANELLKRAGWRVVTLWECELGEPGKLERTFRRLLRARTVAGEKAE